MCVFLCLGQTSGSKLVSRDDVVQFVEQSLALSEADIKEKIRTDPRDPFDLNNISAFVFQYVEYLYKLTVGDLETQIKVTNTELALMRSKIALVDDALTAMQAVAHSHIQAGTGMLSDADKTNYGLRETFLRVLKGKYERVYLYLRVRLPRLQNIKAALDHLRLITTSNLWDRYVNPAFMYSYTLSLLQAMLDTLGQALPFVSLAFIGLEVFMLRKNGVQRLGYPFLILLLGVGRLLGFLHVLPYTLSVLWLGLLHQDILPNRTVYLMPLMLPFLHQLYLWLRLVHLVILCLGMYLEVYHFHLAGYIPGFYLGLSLLLCVAYAQLRKMV